MKTHIMRIAILILLIGAVLGLSSHMDLAGAQTGSQKSTPNPKIDSVLAQLLQMLASSVSSQAVQQAASRAGVPIQDNAITVVAEVSGPTAGLVSAIAALLGGGTVKAQSRNFLELKIPLSSNALTALLQLVTLSGIAYIRPPLVPQALVLSEGVSVTGASSFHSSGLRGQGTKIAVIDLGFIGLSSAQTQGELPMNLSTRDFSGTGLETTTSHGTAVAEIIYDMAPAAQLYLLKIADEVDLENAIDYAIGQGVDIINHSVAWFNTSFYDGTGPIAAAVQRARAADILWVNAAGNYARRHWQGFAQDTNGNGFVEFAPGREGLQFTAQAGEAISIYLSWQDWPRSAQDYDLFLTTSSGVLLASSERLQNGSQPPAENLFFRPTSGGTFEIRVRAANVTSARQLAIFNLNQDITPSVAQGSIVTPADSSAAMAVGAIHYLNWTTGPIQPFSSQGPTTDGRTKPDISGPDSVTTTTAGFSPFIGTSASAPHVAGAAALLLSENPTLTASGLETRLKGSAVPMGSPTQFGTGRLNLSPTQPTRRPDLIVLSPSFFPVNPRLGDTITLTAQVRNQGDADAGPFAVELRDSFGNLTQNVPGLAAGASTAISFNRPLLSSSMTFTITADVFNQVSESNETNNSTSLSVTAQSQPSLGIDVRTDRTSYLVGDPIRVQFTTNADGSVYLYDVDAQGLATILYPTSESANAFLRAGSYDLATLLGVSQLRVTDPTGLESIHGLIVSSPVNLGLSGQRNLSFTDPNTFRAVLGQRIQAINPSLSWAWDVASFQVLAAQPTNQPPVAQFVFNPTQPLVNDSVTFDGSSSFDPDGSIVDWRWIFEGTTRVEASGVRVTVRFVTARAYRVTLIVTDNRGATGSTSQLIEVLARPSNQPPVARFTFSPSNPQVGQIVTFDGQASSDPDGAITSYRWDLNGDGITDATGAIVQASYSQPGTFTVTLTVIDNAGLSGSTSQTLQVSSVPLPPPPPTPQGLGFFIKGDWPNQFQLIVQGDPSWTSDHEFRVLLAMVSTSLQLSGFTSIDVQVIGNATPGQTEKDRLSENTAPRFQQPLLTGRVRDGKILYTIGVANPTILRFSLQLDIDGDGDLEGGLRQIPTFVLVGGEAIKLEPRSNQLEFTIRADPEGTGPLLPFQLGRLYLCNEDTANCVPIR